MFSSFESQKVKFRHAATAMIAGAPGSYKSILTLNLAVGWARQGQKVLYFAGDVDEFTVIVRLSGILTGDTMEKAEGNILKKRTQEYVKALRRVGHLAFEYDKMDMDGIVTHVNAFEAVYGDFPDVIVIDSLLSYVDSAGEWECMRETSKQLDTLARETKAHIIIDHHTSETVGYRQPPARDKVQGKITQVPRMVITVAAVDNVLHWSCVKNTHGPQHPEAEVVFDFLIEPSMRVVEVRG